MVAVFNKELLSWYLISLKLKEIFDAGMSMLQESPTPYRKLNFLEQDKLHRAHQEEVAGSWAKLCIYRIPKSLCEADKKAYIPQMVSLGLFHNGKKHLKEMDTHKWQSLYQVLRRTKHDIKHYFKSTKELEEKARACYGGPITLSSYQFVEVLVLDGCFMLELFRGASGGFKELGYSNNDLVFAMCGIMYFIQHDMIMLENQISLFILDHLLSLQIELRDAGIKFKKRKTDRFWDIKFENGVLHIPWLIIHDGTKSLLLNLIAFVQCHLDCTNCIASYVILMDNLIISPEDVGHLHYCGIIEYWLGSNNEVPVLFDRLCQEVVFDINNSYPSHLLAEVNLYYNQRWNAWRTTLMRNYFNNPWTIISFFAAVLLLLLTFTQSFYGVYGYYYNPRG
ncbi:hypothetical protein GIB67_016358 [Kingdonia uniflora]|uniref:Uncharacterized protein n=1 Tax=Kingdonia uniflora TaxID=39325 RepID=A0A7J7M9I1_9MAGN|nr:hypothetical protein GIB67_016358 [Kingdonia uniflora]